MQNENVLIIGASSDTQRYANHAQKLLKQNNHNVLLINPNESIIMGEEVYPSVKDVINSKIKVDTITMYVNPTISQSMIDDIVLLNPNRVIFNPGTENHSLIKKLKEKNILVQEACTLVLLSTKQF